MKAYQRQIRELEDTRDPRPVVPLDGCAVERVTPAWAAKIVLRYEWLQTMPTRTVACYGLVGPGGEPLGVSVFGYGGGSAALDVCGRDWRARTLVLERGACVHYTHEHAPSFSQHER